MNVSLLMEFILLPEPLDVLTLLLLPVISLPLMPEEFYKVLKKNLEVLILNSILPLLFLLLMLKDKIMIPIITDLKIVMITLLLLLLLLP